MSRYFPPPDDYKPQLVFQLREWCEGGELRANVLQIPALDARREAVVLVHGYNNHYGEAGLAYHGFRRCQYAFDSTLADAALERILADAFWPGDAAWGVADLVDFLVYPAAVTTAKEAAPKLADHLRGMPNLLKVHFIGHSLGCRLILEVIDRLRAHGAPVIGRVCLMAAAVPVFKVERGDDLADAMQQAEIVLVLYSESDAVLRWTFGPGQTLASGREGFFPAALGRRHPPPTVAGRIEAVHIHEARHSDYWGYTDTAASEMASKEVGNNFQFGSLRREIASREAAASGEPPETRSDSAPARRIGDGKRGCRV